MQTAFTQPRKGSRLPGELPVDCLDPDFVCDVSQRARTMMARRIEMMLGLRLRADVERPSSIGER